MTALVLALYAEGRTDERFLPIIIQRTAEDILLRRGRRTIDVLEPTPINGDIDHQVERRKDRIVEAARRALGFHVLIVHADADHPTPERALNERIMPGILAAARKDNTCRLLVPLVPVRMTEAWMLADPQALSQVIGTNLTAQDLGLPERPHQVESEPQPRQRLREATCRARAQYPRRRRRLDLGELYEPLARQIRLERLRGVPAYQRFVTDLTKALHELGFIEP